MLVNASCISLAGSFPAMAKSPADRLQEARAEAGFATASEAARSLGVPEQTYLAHENGNRGITAKAGEHYASRFKVEFTWLMTNKGPKRIGAGAGYAAATSTAAAIGVTHRALAPDMRISMRQIPVIGYVQAGVWLTTIELPPADRFDVPLPVQSGFDGFVVQGLVVRGPSMDELYPHGSILAVVSFLDLGRDPRNGERIVALRHRHGESEATVKEYRIGRDGKARLWPRSSHPDFQQPIAVDQPNGEDEELHIAYLVIGSYRPEV